MNKSMVRQFVVFVLLPISVSWGMPPQSGEQLRENEVIPLWQMDRLSTNDQMRYIEALTESIEAANRDDSVLSAKLKQFFKHHTDDVDDLLTLNGWEKVQINIAYARLADLQTFAKNPKVDRLYLGDVIYATLVQNGINPPQRAWKQPFTFQRQDPLKPIATMDYAIQQVKYAKQMAEPVTETKTKTTVQRDGWTDTDTAIAFFGVLALAITASSNATTTNSGTVPKNSATTPTNNVSDYPMRGVGMGLTRLGNPCIVGWDPYCYQ
jgi:hypothetical protein